MAVCRVLQATRLVADVMERQGWLGRPVGMTPEPGRRLEAVPGRQPPAVASDQRDRPNDVVEDGFADEVVEVHPDPAWLDPFAAAGDLALERMGRLDIDTEQPMTVWPGARAASPGLDPEQVVEQRDHEVVMEVPVVVPDRERHDRETRQRGVLEYLHRRRVGVGAIREHEEDFIMLADRVDADPLLEL